MVLVLLLGAIGAGLRIPGLSYLSGLPGLGLLDYRTLASGGFLPLRAGYVDQLLGTSLSADRAFPAGFRDAPTDPAGRPATVPFAPLPDGPQPTRPGASAPDHPFTNDDMDSPVVITALPYTARTDNRDATRQPGEPDSCAPRGGTAWYSYTAKRDSTLLTDTIGSDHPTAIGVFTQGLTGLQQVGCASAATGNSQLGFTARAGRRYLFQLTGLVTGGRLTFHLAALGRTTLSSPSAAGHSASEAAREPVTSGNGRYVAFTSAVCPYDATGQCPAQIYVTDRRTGGVSLVSRNLSGKPGNGPSTGASLSHDGRYIGFMSAASDLVPGDANTSLDYFVHDRQTRRTQRVSVALQGREGSAVPGRPLPSDFDPTGRLSADGRFAIFVSRLDGLVAGDAAGADDVFLHDLRTGRTTRESVDLVHDPGRHHDLYIDPRVSEDGRYVAFLSTGRLAGVPPCPPQQAPCVNAYVRDRQLGRTRLLSLGRDGRPDMAAQRLDMSTDGRLVAWTTVATLGDPADTNGISDVFVVDATRPDVPRRVSLSSAGAQQQDASRLDANTVSGGSGWVAVSGDGSRVGFSSGARNLAPDGDQAVVHVYVRDLPGASTTRVSVASTGEPGAYDSHAMSLSHDGRVIAFETEADNLVPEDEDVLLDVLVHDLSGV